MSYRGRTATSYVALNNMRERTGGPPVLVSLAWATARLIWTGTRLFTQVVVLLWTSMGLRPVGYRVVEWLEWLSSREKIGPFVNAVLYGPWLVGCVLKVIYDQEFSSIEASVNGMPSELEFEYYPLPDSRRMIRLIELYPADSPSDGSEPKPIVTTLKEVSLHDYPRNEPFVAISYCWGPPAERAMIACNGRALSITKSLHNALLCLRDGTKKRLLWADAICINQRDDDEKSFQVRLMRQIYEKAESVAVWLGGEADNSGRVLHLSNAFGDVIRKSFAKNSQGYKDVGVQQALFQHLPSFSHSGWSAMGQLLQRPWFGRAWIIQEIAVPRDVMLFCGTSSTRWTAFSELLSFMLDAGLLESHPDNHVERAMALVTTRRNYQNKTPEDFLGIMMRHRPCQATIGKDKIFALSGLVDFPVRPNYLRSDEVVFADAATAVVRSASGLDILMVPHAAARTKRLPSWVPDWTDIPSCAPLIHRSRHQEDGVRFQAAGGLQKVAAPSVIDESRVLLVEGLIFDTIGQVSEVAEGLSWGRSISDIIYSDCRFYSTLTTWEEVGRPDAKTRYVTGETAFDAYWRTLLAGKASEDEVEYYRAMFHRFGQTWSRWRYVFRLPLPTALLYLGCWVVGMLSVFVMYAKHQLLGGDHLAGPDDSSEEIRLFKTAILNKRLVRTQGGYLGLAASGAQKGDQIALLRGCRVPVILRRQEGLEEWQFVGDGYVHGIMYGEAFKAGDCRPLRIA